eukprot:Nk52_evm5s116 gene=Nk52_evmTU5s116
MLLVAGTLVAGAVPVAYYLGTRNSSSSSSSSTPVEVEDIKEAKEKVPLIKTNDAEIYKGDQITHVGWIYPILTSLLMIGGPLGIYWAWACLEFNQGAMILPKELTMNALYDWIMHDVIDRVIEHAIPGWKACGIYCGWLLLQWILFVYAPGPYGKGAPLINDPSSRLQYHYNGQFAWFTTLALVLSLHFSGMFPLTELYNHYPELLTMCNITTTVVTGALFLYAKWKRCGWRETDSWVYDLFMGLILNPRTAGGHDIKFFFELRPGIMHWYFTTLALAAKQYETYGTISTPMALVCFFHLCFVNACYKGEQCVPASMDIIYENFGWMLCWLDIVVVPFIFPMSALYLYKIGPMEHSLGYTLAVAFMHILGYWIFDTANSQKDYFREKPDEEISKGFPRLPWDKLENPEYMDTKRGTKLLTSGWWGLARHINYTGDLLMAWSWGMVCGFNSFFPFFYAVCYLTPLLIHRERRDNDLCKQKYGEDWDKYCKKVPYRLIPYVY